MSAGNRKTWLLAVWFKKPRNGSRETFLDLGTASSDTSTFTCRFEDGGNADKLRIAGGSSKALISNQVRRDPIGWQLLVVAMDTTQTSAPRTRAMLNGEEVTWASATHWDLNQDTAVNSAATHYIGYNEAGAAYSDFYIARYAFIEGYPTGVTNGNWASFDFSSLFGYQNTEINEWVTKSQSQVLAVVEAGGTNSFMLDFDDATSLTTLGYDKSTKNNDWTLNNVSLTSGVTYDHMLDVPGNSYCTLNPLDKDASVSSITDGNLKVTGSSANYHAERSAMAIPAGGKWSGAFTILGSSNAAFGLCAASVDLAAWASGATANAWIVDNQAVSGRADLVLNGATRVAVTASGVAMLQNSVGKWAYDADTGKLWLGDSAYGWYPATLGGAVGDPAAGTNPTATISTSLQLFVFSGGYGTTGSICADFGQQGYTPPTGFLALCQANLPTVAITNPKKHFDVVTYLGNLGTKTVTGFQLQPDLLWIKQRDGTAQNHAIVDSLRGVTHQLSSSLTNAENTTTDAITSLNSDGFSLGANSTGFNVNAAQNYVSWLWKANGAGVSNTDGSITSTVSANVEAGFSIVTYTGTGANATVGHGLGAVPKLIIVKKRSGGVQDWGVYHANQAATPQNNTLYLNLTNATIADPNMWNNTAPTSTVFSVGTSGTSNPANPVVAYCFAEIPGYSKIGSYTGNGSADGPFVYCGFRPRYILIKVASGTTGGWILHDTARDTYNAAEKQLQVQSSAAEAVTGANKFDILSSGFKLRGTDSATNGSTYTYIFYAIADVAGKYALAR